jgi:uncharacterized membrane protein
MRRWALAGRHIGQDIIATSITAPSEPINTEAKKTSFGGKVKKLIVSYLIPMRRWALAGRHIGQDIMGTMTNILLFSYLSGSLPMFLIYFEVFVAISHSSH